MGSIEDVDAPTEVVPGALDLRRPKVYEAGLFLVVVVVPLAFLPSSTSPFADLKLVVLALGVLLLWASSPRLDRTIALLAAGWFGVSVLGTIFGVDPGRSITGTENAPAGVALVLLCAYLVAAGARMPRHLQERLPGWVAGTAAVVAAVAILWRIWSGAFSMMPNLSFGGSTLGNPVFMVAFVSLGLLALPHLRLPLWLSIGCAALFGVALAVWPQRMALISSVVGFGFSVWHSGAPRKRIAIVALSASIGFLTWGVVPSLGGGTSTIEQGLSKPGYGYRMTQLSAIVKAAEERPIFGWGPGNTLSAWIEGGAPDRTAQWADAHNIFVEQLAATGFVGVLAFLALAGTLTVRILKRPRLTGWLAGAVATLVFLHLVEPLNVGMTGLAFLVLGIASSKREAPSVEPLGRYRTGRKLSGVLLAGVFVISILTLTSAVLEQYASEYYSIDHGELWLATRITPWRIKSSEDLATQLALDGRAGDETRAAQALALAEGMLDEHPWFPGVYLEAVAVHVLMLDPEGAAPVIKAFEQRFPMLAPPVIIDRSATSLGPVG